ncbi:unnamed protein product [Mucor hiemalis]
MTTKNPSDTEFSYRLTESLLSRKTSSTLSTSQQIPPLAHQRSTTQLITSISPNALVINEKNSKSSFSDFIGKHFKEDAPVLLDRLAPPTVKEHPSEGTYWSYPIKEPDSHSRIEGNDKWSEYDSIISEEASLIATTPELFSIGAFLFIFGFLCPPCWWIGSFYPTNLKTDKRFMDEDLKMALRWRLLNRFFSLGFSVLLLIAIIVLVIMYTKN